MRISLKTLQQHFPKIPLETLEWIRAFLKTSPKFDEFDGRMTQGHRIEARLDLYNKLLEGHGVECIKGDKAPGGYWFDSVCHYVNMGDTYVSTIYYDTVEDVFRVGCWGDFVEKYGEKYGIK